MKDIISNCFLCEEHSLHVAGTEEAQVMQCINCGYVTTTKYLGTKETNEEFQKLTPDMQKWSIEKNGRIWVPSIMTLPVGMVYPKDVDNLVSHKTEMKWAFAPMVVIPENQRKDFPNKEGGYFDRRIDTKNELIYDIFFFAIHHANELMKKGAEIFEKKSKENQKNDEKINLPKLKNK